ncbi:hypothetical protein MUK42_24024 [Musa troglodytarum]|uniref:Uncharacterized protein n=1 Tax=Musa troglodytarum TaxID=320322 RepID=A0A9E7KAZ8_9LILI|nr:hypothetical protein MUK42_24024 [Musa troglodytarum]
MRASIATRGESRNQLPLGWVPPLFGCHGTVAECLSRGEFELHSEVCCNVLATSNYINYIALHRAAIPSPLRCLLLQLPPRCLGQPLLPHNYSVVTRCWH